MLCRASVENYDARKLTMDFLRSQHFSSLQYLFGTNPNYIFKPVNTLDLLAILTDHWHVPFRNFSQKSGKYRSNRKVLIPRVILWNHNGLFSAKYVQYFYTTSTFSQLKISNVWSSMREARVIPNLFLDPYCPASKAPEYYAVHKTHDGTIKSKREPYIVILQRCIWTVVTATSPKIQRFLHHCQKYHILISFACNTRIYKIR